MSVTDNTKTTMTKRFEYKYGGSNDSELDTDEGLVSDDGTVMLFDDTVEEPVSGMSATEWCFDVDDYTIEEVDDPASDLEYYTLENHSDDGYNGFGNKHLMTNIGTDKLEIAMDLFDMDIEEVLDNMKLYQHSEFPVIVFDDETDMRMMIAPRIVN